MSLALLLVWTSLLPLGGNAEHSPLLPRPQQIHYGSGRFPLQGLRISLPLKPGATDGFAAKQLADFFSNRAKSPIPISESVAPGRLIVLKRTGAEDPLPVPDEHPGPESREAYWLRVTPAGAEIRANSSAGLFYGVQTLCQLVEGSSGEAMLPEVEIHDWPSLAYRGTMVDMSHGPLPTEEEVKRQLDFLARWKANQYYFYSEASIELKGYPLLNPEGRFTQEQVRQIIAYGRERHVDVVPCLELYGHLHDLFRIERYADFAAIPHGNDFNPRDSRVLPLLADWIDQLARLFTSPFVHIGLDEVREVVRFVEARGPEATPSELYLEQFSAVAGLVRQHGKRVLVWSDMFAKYPDLIPKIPAGTIVVPWGYGPTVYEPYWNPFAALPIPKFIATGVSIWNQIAPDFDMSFANIDTFLAAGRQHAVLGLINTLWTDDVSVLMRPAFPGLAYGAVAAWQSEPLNRAQFFSEYTSMFYPPALASEVTQGLQELARAESYLGTAIGGEDKETLPHLWDDPLGPHFLAGVETHRQDLRQARLRAEDAQEHLLRALELGGDRAPLPELLLEARMLDYAGMKDLYALEMADFWRQLGARPSRERLGYVISEISSHNHSRVADLMDAIKGLREPFRKAWLAEYTPYRLDAALGKWDAEFQYWWGFKRRLDIFRESFRDGDPLPPLESFSQEQAPARR